MMSLRVTAIVVVRDGIGPDGTDALPAALDALRAQNRPVDRVLAVALGSPTPVIERMQSAGVDQIIPAAANLSFAGAIAEAVRVLPPGSEDDLLWLLGEDTQPERSALSALVAELEVSPSVAIAAPKIRDAAHPSRILSFGETMTTLGTSVALVEDELDQGQHDGLSDVLGARAAGLLVRHRVLSALGGPDSALHEYDDGLDLGVRARLAGHRVSLVPAARVAVNGHGVASARTIVRPADARRAVRLRRSAQLHRRLVYAPALIVPVHWLSLVPLAIIRVIIALVRKHPETIGAEIVAAFRAAFGRQGVARARRRLRAAKSVPWSALDPLRLTVAEARRARRLRRDDDGEGGVVERTPLHFFDGGAAWVLLASTVAGAAVMLRLLGGGSITGGGLLPLSGGLRELWANASYGWHDLGTGFIGAADPFNAVLAVLGTLTFWQPSLIVVLLLVLALPLATLGGWFAMTRLTERSGLRIAGALLWTLWPPFVVALADGRLHAILLHLLLPWVFVTWTRAARSWAAAGASSLLLAAAVACAPVIAPAALLAWVILIARAGRGIVRVLWTIAPTVTLFAPLVWEQLVIRRNPWGLLADPGVPLASEAPGRWDLALAESDGGTALSALARAVGVPAGGELILLLALMAPLAVLAVMALFSRGGRTALPALVVAVLGLGTAVASSSIAVSFSGGEAIAVWVGTGLSVYGLGLVLAAVIGLDAIPRGAAIPALVSVVALGALAVPTLLSIPLNEAKLERGDGRALPAYVAAAAQAEPRLRTLVIEPHGADRVSFSLLRGSGATLDSRSTLLSTERTVLAEDARLAELVGALALPGSTETADELADLGISFVLVAQAAEDDAPAASQQAAVQAALDANPVLRPIGATDRGGLWSVGDDVVAAPVHEEQPARTALVVTLTLMVIAAALLLSLPTSASRRAAELRPRTLHPVRTREQLSRARLLRRRGTEGMDEGYPVVARPAFEETGDTAAIPRQALAELAAARTSPVAEDPDRVSRRARRRAADAAVVAENTVKTPAPQEPETDDAASTSDASDASDAADVRAISVEPATPLAPESPTEPPLTHPPYLPTADAPAEARSAEAHPEETHTAGQRSAERDPAEQRPADARAADSSPAGSRPTPSPVEDARIEAPNTEPPRKTGPNTDAPDANDRNTAAPNAEVPSTEGPASPATPSPDADPDAAHRETTNPNGSEENNDR